MPFHPSRHRPISWLAIALLLLTSLSPMFKTSGGSGSARVEMCSSHGHAMSAVAAPADGPATAAGSAGHDDGWCKLHCSLLQPASSSMAPSVARNGVQHLSTLQPPAPRPARTWPGALSRAPPPSA